MLDIRVNLQVSDARHEPVRRCVERALAPFGEDVARVDVRIEDVDGAGGAVDEQCTVTVELAGIDDKVVVGSTRSDALEAAEAACAALGEKVSRELTRRGQLSGASAPAPARDKIQVTIADHERLLSLIDTSSPRDADAADALADELDRAELVPAERIAGTVVTMHSRVVFEDQQTGARREVTLVYPHEASPERGHISVLAPIGSALLGLSVGQTIDWPVPRGEVKRLRIVEIVYQPEDAGDMHL